jgi:hypothetical protein
MADISSGPVSSMPGSTHTLPAGALCDRHADRPAIARVQGETDSFGCEYLDVCQECKDEITAYHASPEARTGCCDYCSKHATDLADWRDYDEGMAGPLYRVCGECRRKANEHAAAEAEENTCYEDDDFDDDIQFADPGGTSALRAETADNPRNLPCPTCHEPDRLTPADRARGYQCDSCADRAERGGY